MEKKDGYDFSASVRIPTSFKSVELRELGKREFRKQQELQCFRPRYDHKTRNFYCLIRYKLNVGCVYTLWPKSRKMRLLPILPRGLPCIVEISAKGSEDHEDENLDT